MSFDDDPSNHDIPRPTEAQALVTRSKIEWAAISEAERRRINHIWDNLSEDEKERRREEAEMDLL